MAGVAVGFTAAGVDVAEGQDATAPWRIRVRWRVPILLLVGVALVLPRLRAALLIRERRRGRAAAES